MNIRSILLAADFSQPAKAAGCDARLLARRFGARLTLLHVLPYPLAVPGAPQYGMKLGEWFTGRAEADALELRSFFEAELKDADAHVAVLEGDPASRIAEYAMSSGTDLIVMPAYGQGPFRRLLLGSVTAKVLHDVECPVWTGIHREQLPCSERLAIRNLVCAVGLAPQDDKLVRWASAAAHCFDSRLFLVHVVPGPESTEGEYAVEAAEPVFRRARERAEALNEDCGANAKVIVAGGGVAKAVCAQLEQLGADLLVIGRSPQSAMFGRLPTTAYAIVRDSPCPVVSV